jgi:hypothetical protein
MADQKRGDPADPTKTTPSNAARSPDAGAADGFRTFLVGLATDPARLGAFIKDPGVAMQQAGLSDVDQAILKSGHPATIHARLSGQKFAFGSPTPVTVLVVDMAPASEAGGDEQPSVRQPYPYGTQPSAGGAAMFPNVPLQVLPQVTPQFISPPQILPQIHPQIVQPQIVHPQIVPPQFWPQIVQPQIVHPQIVPPQFWPQIVHPQIVHPQIVPPQFWPQIVHPQIVHPQVVHPVFPPPVWPIHQPVFPPPVFPPPVWPIHHPVFPPPVFQIHHPVYPIQFPIHPIFTPPLQLVIHPTPVMLQVQPQLVTPGVG